MNRSFTVYGIFKITGGAQGEEQGQMLQKPMKLAISDEATGQAGCGVDELNVSIDTFRDGRLEAVPSPSDLLKVPKDISL